ncbi:uncharacterized protein LOC125561361 [Nematostella vectensis]|uniref:uncharacterized protein LOC125561361 n=1 Tax=Nematostella vectensis TaxID=45351 RepID=UPI00207776B9|nr:uncharacterized protein LOC125561361 [Nematostella vectensis]
MKWTGRIFCLFCLLAAANSVNSLECAKFELGLSSKALFPDNHFTASSSYRDDYLPHLARYSNNLAAWGAKINDDPNDYLQIDLGRVYKICAVATKGHEKNNEFVDSYKVLYSMDNLNWGTYQETAGEDKVFERNQIHVSNSVKFELNTSVEAKFIRFVPVTVYGHKSMKVELFGELSNVCSGPLGLENGALDRSTFKASSHPDNAHLARLYSPKGWSAAHATQGQYLQIDLMSARTISGVAIQGCEGGWVSNYILQYGMTNSTWSEYKNEQDSDAHQFEGNKDAAQVRVNWFIRQLRARYIRINPTAWHSSICLRAELFGCQESCDQSPLGLEDHRISNSHITSSSKRDQNSPAHHGRLGFTSANAWCAANDDTQPWIQFDLGADHVVCAIATQGDSKSHSWVTSYKVMYSDDAAKWFHYSEAASGKVFAGNFDKSSVVKHQLNKPIRARYIRVSASKHRGSACLRVELYGSSQSVCSRTSGGIRIGGFIPDYNIRATSIYAPAYTGSSGRLNGPFGWAVGPDAGDDEYLEVDFGYPVVLCGMAIQGSGVIKNNEFVKSYKLQVSQDGRDWKFYSPKDDGEEFLIPGSKDRFDTAKHVLQRPVVAKFIRVYPVEFYSHKTMRIDAFGVRQGWRTPIGMAKTAHQVSSHALITSDDPAFNADAIRFGSGTSWCPENDPDTQASRYAQIDLGQNSVITGVATKGNGKDSWVTEFSVQFAENPTGTWFDIPQGNIEGNDAAVGTAVSWLREPVVARYVRVTPKSFEGNPCFALDLHGNRKPFVAPAPVILQASHSGTVSPSNSAEVTCTAYGVPGVVLNWSIRGQLVKPQPATKFSKGLAESRMKVTHGSAVSAKELGSCQQGDGEDKFKCVLDYTCTAFYHNEVSGGAHEKKTTLHANLYIPKPTTTPPPTAPPEPATKKHVSQPKPKHVAKKKKQHVKAGSNTLRAGLLAAVLAFIFTAIL